MPKYMIEAHYTTEGAKGLAKDGGTGRRAAVVKAAESAGGKLESLYFAFGAADVYAIIELPDNVAAAMALTKRRGGDEDDRPPHARGDGQGRQEDRRLSRAGALRLGFSRRRAPERAGLIVKELVHAEISV
jgi:uncharacterized protein with GYD domain